MNAQPDYQDFSEYQLRVRWRLALGIAVLLVPLLTLVAGANYADQRPAAMLISLLCASLIAVLAVFAWLRGHAGGGDPIFKGCCAILLLVPALALISKVNVHVWFYVFPPILVLATRRHLLWMMLAYGLYATATLSVMLDLADLARFASSYLVVALLVLTSAQLNGRAIDLLQHFAEHDPLTGCLNRRSFDERIEQMLPAEGGTPRRIGLVLLDIDHFKQINDHHGHTVGDQVLADVASQLRNALPAGARLYRYGGEEFAVLLPGFDQTQALSAAEQLRRTVQASRQQVDEVTISAGVVSWDPDTLPIGRAINAADEAMYAAKLGGRNRVSSAALPVSV